MTSIQDVCEVNQFDESAVKKVSLALQQRNTSQAAEMLKALADETRLKILYALTIVEELCVCDVANIIGSSTATASHHLRMLKAKGLAKFRKKGKMVYYSLDDEHVKQLVKLTFAHSEEDNEDGNPS